AVTACSETYPAEEWQFAKKVANSLGANHISIFTEELNDSRFVNNPPERCYYCKSELFGKLQGIAKDQKLRFVLDGANADDTNDFRPGMKAGKDLGIRSPLQEAGLTKNEIRIIAREENLPNWDKPSQPCLSSRFPYGHAITIDKLKQVDEAERFLRDLGFKELRVRHHGNTARIEVPETLIEEIVRPQLRQDIVQKFSSLGFTYITLDLRGFRSGSMNEILPKETINGQRISGEPVR
ncbi:MAG TPA: ATP-dependent sacrificial sulfur transferase LarE, partial [Desulfobacteria bacterium]|nr:ATP-dependent sacrificial sulfur transferase LarE [Desulfobacteria bacterium]